MMRFMQDNTRLPYTLYRSAQVKALDQMAEEGFGLTSEVLMERAGEFAFQTLCSCWPKIRRVTIVCGGGNNGGDAYVLARLARLAGMEVQLLSLVDIHRLPPAARQNAERVRALDIKQIEHLSLNEDQGVIIDGLLGTGIDRPLSGRWFELIQSINRLPSGCLALDIPSGLDADTGSRLGAAIEADHTVTFIGLKQGLFTGEGPSCSGKIHFSSLDVPAGVYATQTEAARRIDWRCQSNQLPPLPATAHKGSCGRLLVIGGEAGTAGAARLAAEGGLRAGAGLVSIATRSSHAASLVASRPEIMVHGVEQAQALQPLLARADALVLGPGLGQGEWSKALFETVCQTEQPLILDADGLNLLAKNPQYREHWILTPHPGEAARLLQISVQEVQQDRFAAAMEIQNRYGGVVVLKGAGTLVQSSRRTPGLCSEGNPGMASAGMGDLLSGILGALLAQTLSLEAAAETGVCLHAAAGDAAAIEGQRSLIASDLLPQIRRLLG